MKETRPTGANRLTSIALRVCAPALALQQFVAWAQSPSGPTYVTKLDTPSFLVRIEVNCREGAVTCGRVTYRGKSKKTGRQLIMTGKTVYSMCADGVTPCRFVGYEFRNGTTAYLVTEDGQLLVKDNGRVLVDEHGTLE